MSRSRLLYVFVVVALAVTAALTVRQAVATTEVVSATSGQPPSAAERASSDRSAEAEQQCPFTAEERRSLRAVYLEQAGIWVPRTDQGYTGYEGGLLALRFCR